jgi:hypothetical protein
MKERIKREQKEMEKKVKIYTMGFVIAWAAFTCEH